MGGKLIIKRTLNGYHLEAPFARLTRQEQELATVMSHADSGYKWWSIKHGRATLRIDDKPIVKMVGDRFVGKRVEKDIPQIIKVIE